MVSAIDERVPPPGPGDKLSREEFLRRWEAHPEIKRAAREFVAQLAANKARLNRGNG